MLLSDELFKRKLVEIVGTLSQKKAICDQVEPLQPLGHLLGE
jgi:hypothetical protein